MLSSLYSSSWCLLFKVCQLYLCIVFLNSTTKHHYEGSYRKQTLIWSSNVLKEKCSTTQKMIELQSGPMTTFLKLLGFLNHHKFLSCLYAFWGANCQHFAEDHFNLVSYHSFHKFRVTLLPISSLSSQKPVQKLLLSY